MPYDLDIGDGSTALDKNILSAALDGTYWLSGWDATLGTGDLEVDIAAGSGVIDGTDVSTGSTQTIDFTGDPDASDPRKAVIYVDATGTVQKLLGTPASAEPSAEVRFRTYNPAPPASVSGVVVAEMWLAASETVLESADVRDRRVSNSAAEVEGVPAWEIDGNSPQTVTNTNSLSYTLAGEYDFIEVDYIVTKTTGDSAIVDLQVNNVTSDYSIQEISGTTLTSQSEVQINFSVDGSINSTVKMNGRWESTWNCGQSNPLFARNSASAQAGSNETAISPLTEFELFENGTGTPDEITVVVRGRDIE